MSYVFICLCFLFEDHLGWRKLRDHTIPQIACEQIIVRGNLVLRILYLVCISIRPVYVSMYDTIHTCFAKGHWSRQKLIINLIQQIKYKMSVLAIHVMCSSAVNSVMCNCLKVYIFVHTLLRTRVSTVMYIYMYVCISEHYCDDIQVHVCMLTLLYYIVLRLFSPFGGEYEGISYGTFLCTYELHTILSLN